MNIHKYTISKEQIIKGQAFIKMPLGASILDAQVQHGDLVLWAAVDPMEVGRMRHITMVFTGREVAGSAFLAYVATVQMDAGDTVIHLFDNGYTYMTE